MKDGQAPKRDHAAQRGFNVFFVKKSLVWWMGLGSACRDLLSGTGSYLYQINRAQRFATATWQDDIEAEEVDVAIQSQLDVVRGLVTPPFGAHLPASQWRSNNVGIKTNTPVNLDSSVSRSRTSSAARNERI